MDDIAWFFLSMLAFSIGTNGVTVAIDDLRIFRLKRNVLFSISYVITFLQSMLVFLLWRLYRGVPYQSIGCFRKATVEVITLCASLVVRQLLPCDIWFLIALVGFTTALHTVGKVLHVTADVNLWDVLLGVLMQIPVYLTGNNLYICSAVLIFCGGVIYYRYLSYTVPFTPDDVKKDLGDRQDVDTFA